MMKKRLLQSVEVTAPTSDGPVWVEVARSGSYKGYSGGGFDLSVERLAEVARNVRSHPSFAAGADGFGTAPVVPWDFNHASEMPPTNGSIPSGGAPAQGWVLDVDVRPGPTGASLWALTQWGDLAREYIRAGQYRWASVTLVFDAKDPKTGASVGTLLTSIALTNTPFIEGMQPLAASRGSAAAHAQVMAALERGDDAEVERLAALYGQYEPLQLAKGARVRWPGSRSRKTPQARTLIASLVASGVTVVCDDGFVAKPEEEEAADVKRPAPLDARGASGRNATERAINLMRERVTGFASLSWEQQCEQAGRALASGVVAA